MAEALLIDGETCVVIDGLEPPGIVDKIIYFNQAQRYNNLCRNAYKNFKKHVDFDKEEIALHDFLARLI